MYIELRFCPQETVDHLFNGYLVNLWKYPLTASSQRSRAPKGHEPLHRGRTSGPANAFRSHGHRHRSNRGGKGALPGHQSSSYPVLHRAHARNIGGRCAPSRQIQKQRVVPKSTSVKALRGQFSGIDCFKIFSRSIDERLGRTSFQASWVSISPAKRTSRTRQLSGHTSGPFSTLRKTACTGQLTPVKRDQQAQSSRQSVYLAQKGSATGTT